MRNFLIAALVLAVPVLYAGGPLSTHNGKAVRFTSDTVRYHLDRGTFGIFTSAQARALAVSSFQTWEDVATSSVTFNHQPGDTLPVDVTASNFLQYTTLSSVKIDGINPIVFDSDGGITDAMFGAGAKEVVIGFAWVEDVDGDGYYDEGEAFMNGSMAMGDANSFTYEEWKSTFVHEFGHFLGLDHCQINGEFVNTASKTQYIPTMFPTSTADDVPLGDLNPDDIASISRLYPAPGFASVTGTIAGSVTRSAGTPVRGANVIVSSTGSDSLMNRLSTVTDYFEQNTGGYAVAGLSPGSYHVRIEPIDPEFIEGSSVGPYASDGAGLSFVNPVTPEFYNGAGESGDGATDDPNARTVVNVAAGVTVSGIDLIANGRSATASVLLTENFDFTGALTANGWSAHSGAGTNSPATTTGLTYAGHPGSGIGSAALLLNLGGEDVNRDFAAQTGTEATVYTAALVSVTDTASAKTGDQFLHIGERSNATTFTAFSSRLFARIVGGQVNFGISNTSTAMYGAAAFAKNTVHLAVMKYTVNMSGTDRADLWIFPSGVPASEAAAGPPLVSNTGTSGQDNVNAVGLRQGNSSSSVQAVVDGIIVSTGWPFASTGVRPSGAVEPPAEFSLAQNHPNPFNPETAIRFSLPHRSDVRLSVHDVLGREVALIMEGTLSAGEHRAMFNGRSFASGVYFYRLQAGSNAVTRRMVLLK